MIEAVGGRVTRLVRTRIGPLRLDDLPSGGWRDLTPEEIRQLREAGA
jgi:16S rRNA U516 pseudouridylate synthase RsuA-like enzyme